MSNAFDSVIDGTSIDAALSASGSYYVKSGTYSSDGTITIDQNNTKIVFEPATTINVNTSGILLTANNCVLDFYPGITLDNNSSAAAWALTISGTDNHIRFRNKGTIGNISITSAGHRNYIHGGGWGTLIEHLDFDGDDCVVKWASFNNKASGTNEDCVETNSTGGRGRIEHCKIIDSDGRGIVSSAPDTIIRFNHILDADGDGIILGAARHIVIGS